MTTAQLAFYVPGLTCSIVGMTLWAWNDSGAGSRRRSSDSLDVGARACVQVRTDPLPPSPRKRGRRNRDNDVHGLWRGGVLAPMMALPSNGKSPSSWSRNARRQVRSQRLERDLGGRIERGLEEVRRDFDARRPRDRAARTERVGLRRTGVALVIVGLVLLALYPLVQRPERPPPVKGARLDVSSPGRPADPVCEASYEKARSHEASGLHRWRGLEPPRPMRPLGPQPGAVYQFRHQRERAVLV